MLQTPHKETEQLPLSHLADLKWYNHFGKQLAISCDTNMHLPFNPDIPLFTVYPRNLEINFPQKTGPKIFHSCFMYLACRGGPGEVIRKRQISGVRKTFCIFSEVVVTQTSAFVNAHRLNVG